MREEFNVQHCFNTVSTQVLLIVDGAIPFSGFVGSSLFKGQWFRFMREGAAKAYMEYSRAKAKKELVLAGSSGESELSLVSGHHLHSAISISLEFQYLWIAGGKETNFSTWLEPIPWNSLLLCGVITITTKYC